MPKTSQPSSSRDNYTYGEEFEALLVDWLKADGINAVRTAELYGEASESVGSASINKAMGDVLIMGTPILIDAKRGYFIAKNYDKKHPFKGWFAMTNHSMEKEKTVLCPAGVIKSWIDKKIADKDSKWDKSSIGNEGVKFDPEKRSLRAFVSYNDFVKKVKDGSISV